MGRNASFDSDVVVAAARDVFWEKGYDATSISDLEAATGLHRSSLYHAFASKRGLFDAVVTDYLDVVIRPRLRVLLDPPADHAPDAADPVVLYFDALRDAVESLPDESPRQGCLLVNCAAGLAGHDEAARAIVDAYRAELTAALRHALAEPHALVGPAALVDPPALVDSPPLVDSAAPGESTASVDPAALDEQARTLTSLSMSAMLLARINRDESVALLRTAVRQAESWRGRVVAASRDDDLITSSLRTAPIA